MRTVTAAVLVKPEQPLETRYYPLPEELAPGEALVRVQMTGLCGVDVHLWLGQLQTPMPIILGHETAGRIEKLGPGLKRDWRGLRLAEGDRITWASSIVCGECHFCRVKRQPTRCLYRKAYGVSYCADEPPHLHGGYAERMLLRAGTAIFRLPDDLPTEAVIGAGCGLPTAIHGVERAPIHFGDVVVIQGAGTMGLAAVAVARESGASRVIVIGGPAQRLALARLFGANAVISVDEVPDVTERRNLVLQETGPFGADIVIECVGQPCAVPEGMDLCRDGGKYLLLGQHGNAGEVPIAPHTITRKQLQVFGSWGFEPRHLDRGLAMLEGTAWKDRFAAQVTHRYPLAQANEALDSVRSCRSGKAVLVP